MTSKQAIAALCAVAFVAFGCKQSKIVKPDVPVVEDVKKDGKPDTGILLPPGHCQASTLLGCTSEYAFKVCKGDGTGFVEVKCGNGQLCFGSGECRSAICIPGTKKCHGPTTVSECAEDGTKFIPNNPCEMGLVCNDDEGEAQCVSSCGGIGKAISNVGCAYALVDLGNYESDPKNKLVDRPVLVVVSNASGVQDAHVNIRSTLDDALLPYSPEELTVPPQELRTYLLPTGSGQLTTSINKSSWTLISDQPVTAHLFNPQNGPDVRSNDATLLFPTDALGKDYRVMGWRSFYTDAQGLDDQGYPKYGFDSYVTVVAVEQGETTVTIRPTANIRPSIPGVVPVVHGIKAGEETTITLKQWEVANFTIEPQLAEMDLTGTAVTGNRNIAVFTAHNCAFVPSIDVKYCDHLEYQLAPIKTWGNIYAADLFHPRAPGAYDVWRVMASQDETVISTQPAIPGFESQILKKGQWIEYQAAFPHIITAAVPAGSGKARIQVGHYMTGSNIPNFDPVCGDALTGIGDPAFTVGVALNQYIDNYVVLTPPGYSDDYLNIVRKTGEVVMLDGEAITIAGVAIGETGYELVRLAVQDGVHQLVSPDAQPFGVTAFGYDCDVSYAYPGGMLLTSN